MNHFLKPAFEALALLSVFALAATPARGEHARIRLEVTSPAGRQEAFADEEPPIGGQNPPRRVSVKAGEPLVLQFFFTNTYPHHPLDGALVHYFVVRLEKPDAKSVPDLKQGVVTQGTVKLNFKPKGRVGARLKFRVTEPGAYLMRVESQHTQSDHEHFAAIYLDAK